MMIPLRLLLAPTLFVAGGLAACVKVDCGRAIPLIVDLTVEGMTCSGCEDTICSRVRDLPGIKSCVAHFESGKVEVGYQPGATNPAQITDAIRSAGFEVPEKP